MRHFRIQGWLVLLAAIAGFSMARAHDPQTTPEMGKPLTIEGEITALSMDTPAGPPEMMLKTADGKFFLVHFGPLRTLRVQGFSPKVGDRVTVAGTVCCDAEGMTLLHSKEIKLGEKTFKTPMTMQQMKRQWPKMTMGSGMGGSGAMGSGSCPNCPHEPAGEMHHEMHQKMHP